MHRSALFWVLIFWGCDNGGGRTGAFSAFQPGPTPRALHQGEVFFNTYCLSCHGLHGTGEGLGPALLDTLFLPGRLSDEQMLGAVERGVPQTHFHFGAMPPNKRLTRDQTTEIIAYVRWLQERADTTVGKTP